MKRRLCIVVVVLVLIAGAAGLALGCGTEPAETTTTAASGSTTVTLPPADTTTGTTGSSNGGFTNGGAAGPFAEPPYLSPQPVDLAAIVNLDKVLLSEAQRETLARQSFVAVMPGPQYAAWKFWHVYETARYSGLPVLVTTDSLLNAYHGLFDTLLQRMEEASLYDQVVAMTEALYAAADEQSASATDPAVKEAARLNLAFFSVADCLLKGPGALTASPETEAELALIEAAAEIVDSPILGYKEDYTQYKPRGHYTRSEKLQRYFKAMMWYGHTAFYINPRAGDITPDEAIDLTRRAALVSSTLVGPAREAWLSVYEPTSFLVGRADDLTIEDMDRVLVKVLGTSQPQPDDLAADETIEALREELNKLPAPKILTAVAPGVATEGREESQRSFRVMGQRYIPDSYAFQQLVWAYVGTEEKKREFPMGLDAMIVLGSDQAYKIAKEDYGQDQFAKWEDQIKKVHREFAGKDATLWPANLYTGWLESLQHVMAFPGDGAPAFMKSRSWARKSLNTALGSWTELRHDTILYAKQSVAAEGDGGEEPPSAGYVEPYPAFYAKMAELAATLKQGMEDYNLMDSEALNKLETMIELAQTLQAIAQKELTGGTLTADELSAITWYGSSLESLETWSTDSNGMTLSPAAEKSPLIADVHSGYLTGQALEEATGYPLTLYAAFELDGKLQIFCGASYAYYEFLTPLDERLTDEEWQAMLDAGQAPPRPAWTNEWIVE